MNALTKVEGGALATMDQAEVFTTLRNSLYPGAREASVKLVLAYCQAAQLDPMQKPVHIVPMYVEDKETGKKETRDVIMPGIGLYRTQAARSGRLGGIDEPVFGPDVEFALAGKAYVVPEWCAVTVYRVSDGVKSAFTAKEFWIENYATAGRDTDKPNSMWNKRPRGQIAKCAEAQALRKAFPEVGSAPTAEEMEGHDFASDVPASTETVKTTKSKSNKGADAAPAPGPTASPAAGSPAAGPTDVSDAKVVSETNKPASTPAAAPAAAVMIDSGQVKWLERKIGSLELDKDAQAAMFGRLGIDATKAFALITPDEFTKLKAELLNAE